MPTAAAMRAAISHEGVPGGDASESTAGRRRYTATSAERASTTDCGSVSGIRFSRYVERENPAQPASRLGAHPVRRAARQ